MGVWGVSITGSDTAQDLQYEYPAAFFKYEPEEATALIDAYIRENMFDESDEEEWCNYVYSLANYMWKKGILTEEIKARAIQMIDSGFGLEVWEEAGKKTLEKRKQVLAEFKEKLLSPMPPRKKIKLDMHLERIFKNGDIVAIQLLTAGKPYTKNDVRKMSDEEFHSYDGKYVLLQLVDCYPSWSSAIVPEVKDYWAYFKLFDGVYDDVPTDVNVKNLKPAKIQGGRNIQPCFTCECSMFYFKKRNYQVLGNSLEGLKPRDECDRDCHIFFSVNKPWGNPDSDLLAAMGK